MQISLIAALTKNHLIGDNNQLIWHLPDDLKRFKSLTLNKSIIMGRNTFDSIGKPLPKRHNIVITRDPNWQMDGVTVAHSADAAIAAALKNTDAEGSTAEAEIMIIGGAQIYQLFLPQASKLYLTWVEYPGQGDTHFPPLNLSDWQIINEEQHPIDTMHDYAFRFVDYQKPREDK